MKCALLQLNSSIDPDENARCVAELMEGVSAGLFLTPEMTPLLQKDKTLLEATVAMEAETVAPYQDLAREHATPILLGSAAVRKTDGRLANRSFLLGPHGEIQARYDKIHLFEAALPGGENYRESDSYAAGTAPRIATVDDMRIGLSICYDVRFPALYAHYGAKAVDLIAVPSAFTQATGRAHWETLLRARAIETGAWVLAPAQGGQHQDDRRTWGRSLAVSPWGEIVAHLDHDAPGVLEVEIDRESVREARARIPAWRQRQLWIDARESS